MTADGHPVDAHPVDGHAVDGAFASAFRGYEEEYESFDDRPGFSDSAAKWRALGLGPLDGLALLDVGCNEGYFVGRARAEGAAFACGFDAEPEVIDEARRRFPDAAFVAHDWDEPWAGAIPRVGDYDVCLMLSVFHYSEHPAELLARVAEALRPGGLLVLEVGVAEGPGERVRVERAHDTTWHFTRSGLDALLTGWVVEGERPSIGQATDPVPRVVIRARTPRPPR
jgi:SAM-dependent methyltransferase